MRVKATQLGFDGIRRVRPGEIFEVKDGTKGSWFEPLDEPKVEPKVEKTPKKEADSK